MISLTFVGTATMVLRLGEVTVLTDPNFLHQGERAYLGKGMWSRRRTEPSLQPADLPPLDAIVLSHLHGDHWDRVAKRELDKTLPVLTTPEAAKSLSRQGFARATGMPTGWTEEIKHGPDLVHLTSVAGQHGRGALRPMLPPVMGSLYEIARAGHSEPYRLYVTGDTLLTPDVRRAVEQLPPLDAVVLHTGGTRVLGMLATLDDREGCDLLELLEARQAVPIHYDDYPVFHTPLEAFLAEADKRGLRDRVTPVTRGETLTLD